MNDSGGMGILGVIVGAVLVIGVIYFVFGERMGFHGPADKVNINVQAPKSPGNK